MKSNKKHFLVSSMILLGALSLIGCGGGSAGMSGSAKDTEISLRKPAPSAETVVLDAPVYNMADPGKNKSIPAGFYDAPPAIPHVVKDGESVKDADCMSCHDGSDKDTPSVPPSHKIKAVVKSVVMTSNSSQTSQKVEGHAKVTEGVAGQRSECVLCHVPQATNLEPLVNNTFQVAAPKDAGKDALDQLNEYKF